MSDKPVAVLIGDSIAMGCRPLVQKSLSEKVAVLGITGNGGDSSQPPENPDEGMINSGADLIHFNCGLHDLRFQKNAATRDTHIISRSWTRMKRIYERSLNGFRKRQQRIV